jgi:predicted metal-binding membrane protein
MVVFVGLVFLVFWAWVYLYYLNAQMSGSGAGKASTHPNEAMAISGMMKLAPWTSIEALSMFVMWAVMMVGMMVPSATPVILLYARILRKNTEEADPLVPTGAFFAGYLLVWIVFSAAATVMQYGLERVALLSPMMVTTSPVFGGVVLLGAAVYQWTPHKDACLRRCRSPVWFLSTHWHAGTNGALRMGLAHGAYCLGCCWTLMLLLFVGGVMNLLCIAAITIFVLIEKVVPRGHDIGRWGAVLMGLVGTFLIFG